MGSEAQTKNGRLRAAVIGTGKISEEHLRFLSSSPAVELAGVCDLSPSLARFAVTRFGAGRAYTCAQQMLKEERPDVVHILTPPQTHAPLARQCLEAAAHVIVEKPVALSNQQFQELWSLAQSRGRQLIEDHNYRFNEPVLRIEQLLGTGRLGEVLEVEVRLSLDIRKKGSRYMDPNLPHPSHSLPAGVIHEFITHLCYLFLRFMPQYERVRAVWSKIGTDSFFKYDDLDAIVLNGQQHGRIRFCAYTAPDAFMLTVRGSRGWAQTDLFQPHLSLGVRRKVGAQLTPLANHLLNGCGLVRSSVTGFRNKIFQKTPYEGLATFLARTYDSLREGTPPPVSFSDMDRASQLVDDLLREQNRL